MKGYKALTLCLAVLFCAGFYACKTQRNTGSQSTDSSNGSELSILDNEADGGSGANASTDGGERASSDEWIDIVFPRG